MSRASPGVRLLPNAITVLALSSGLSAVQFALSGAWIQAIAAIGVAALLDSLDGRIARLLDASSKIGAELDSLSDAISFGVAPALVLYVWQAHDSRLGWIASLVFAGCMVLRLARFNTLQDDTEAPPYAGEFFVGVPAPAGGLLGLLPLAVTVEFGTGWWSSEPVVWVWTVAIAALLISRVPTFSLKTARVPAKAIAPLLVGVTLLAAAIIQYPLLVLATALLAYLFHIPFAVHRYHWLGKHPEAWDVPARERRAIRRAGTSRRLGLRQPHRPALRRRVAGSARRNAREQHGHKPDPAGTESATGRSDNGSSAQHSRRQLSRHRRRRIGLRSRDSDNPDDG